MTDDPVIQSAALDQQLDDNPVVTSLVKIQAQHWTIIKILIGVIAVMAGLVVAMIFLAVGSSDTAHQAKTAADTANSAATRTRNLCEAGNEFRREQRDLWDYLLRLTAASPPPHETPAEKQQREHVTALFVAHIARVFAPRDCSNIVAKLKPAGKLPSAPAGHGASASNAPQADGQQAPPAPAPPPQRSSSSPTSSRPSSPPTPPVTTTPPSPAPSCDLQHVLRHPLRCLPGQAASAVDPPASGPDGTSWIIAAGVLAALVGSLILGVLCADVQRRAVRSGASADR